MKYNNPTEQEIFKRTIDGRKDELKFTKIVIEKIVKNKAYKANFSYTYGEGNIFMETSIGGTSEANCIEKTEKFLETKLKENEIQKL